MSQDTILIAESNGQRYSMDNLCTQKWLSGHVSGAKQVATWLHERAVELFRDGKDDEARSMRDLSKRVLENIVPQLEQAVKTFALEHPSELPPEKRAKKAGAP